MRGWEVVVESESVGVVGGEGAVSWVSALRERFDGAPIRSATPTTSTGLAEDGQRIGAVAGAGAGGKRKRGAPIETRAPLPRFPHITKLTPLYPPWRRLTG